MEVIAQCNATNIGTYCADDVTDSVEDNLLYLIYMTSILVAAEVIEAQWLFWNVCLFVCLLVCLFVCLFICLFVLFVSLVG